MPSTVADARRLHVAAAVIVGTDNRILVSQRPDHVHQGGLWEFPGGKVEPGERVEQALHRELEEELGIRVTAARPLIRIPHDYPDRSVLLDVWRVDGFSGDPRGREGQPLRWLEPEALPAHPFPAANHPIISAARLPDRYLITPDPGHDHQAFLQALDRSLAAGVRLVQLRARQIGRQGYTGLAEQVRSCCDAHGAVLMANCPPAWIGDVPADGLHLTAAAMAAVEQRPVPADRWLAASCHNQAELSRAAAIGVDFAVLAPVKPTATHPDVQALGWDVFHHACEATPFPVYALGGMGEHDLEKAHLQGGQGFAAIRSLWRDGG